VSASVSSGSSDTTGAVRFAINIPLSSIVYTSPATNNPSPGFVAAPDISPTESKLTILDSTRSGFSVTENSVEAFTGHTIDLNYSGAIIGTNEYISAIIKDADSGKALYYGYFDEATADGNISMLLPEYIQPGNYKLIVMNEQINDSKYTNYAGCDEVSLTVYDGEAPVVTNVYTNSNNTMFKLTASDKVALGKITADDETLIDDTIAGQTNVTKNFATDSIDSWFKVYDASENESLVTNIITDNRGPTVESIIYNNGNYTIRVSDTQSGIWKITNSTGDVIYERYDGILSGT
jgi:hypothetical protein